MSRPLPLRRARSPLLLLGVAVWLAACSEDPPIEPDLCKFATRQLLGEGHPITPTGQSMRRDPDERMESVTIDLFFTFPNGAAGSSRCTFVTREGISRLTAMHIETPRLGSRDLEGHGLKALQTVVSREAWRRSMQ